MFATFASASNHHGRGRHAAWVKALPVNQDLLVRSAPQRVFVPPYVGPSGWIGMYLDEVADWVEVARLLREGYRLVAPKRLLAQLENDGVVDRQPAVKSILPKRPPRSRGNRQRRT